MTQQQVSEIYTDGACSGNPGPGGWGAIIRRSNQNCEEISGFEMLTTNNRMEMMAVIAALEKLESDEPAKVYTDSRYVHDGMTIWLEGWKKNGWRTSDRKDVKNADLWVRLDELCAQRDVTWQWVRGHSGHPENERADLLARNAIVSAMMQQEVSAG